MYAIVNISGKQFKVEEGHTLKVPNQSTDVGEKIKFDKVLLTDDNGNVNIGNPIIKNVSVSATVMENGRDKKIIIFKKKRRKGYKKKNGHRQSFSLIKIDSISKSSSTKKIKTTAKPKAEATKKDKEK
tara:strand:+ start:556 stop:939 length:384 start_codon:yes stop_codon:yes gene_type:complete